MPAELLGEKLESEIERVDAEIEHVKRSVKDHMTEPTMLCRFKARLRALHVRLHELKRNRRLLQ